MAKVTQDQSRRSYVVTELTTSEMFSYTVKKVNFDTVGTLTRMSVTLPAGRILRETGRKLAPGINNGVPTYMVSVYDNQQMITGFIDPNAPVFAVYNNDRPNFLVNNVDPGPGPVQTGAPNPSVFANLTDGGAPVFTNGRVFASTTVTAGLSLAAGTFVSTGTYANIGTYVSTGSYIYSASTITANRGISSLSGNITAGNGNLLAPLGKLGVNGITSATSTNVGTANATVSFTGNPAVGVAYMGYGYDDGTFKKLYVYTSSCSATSQVFLTYAGINNPGALSSEQISDGSFRIVSYNKLDQGNVRFFIVN